MTLIGGTHKQVIDNIIIDNKKLFDEYSKDVQRLNDNERKQFILKLISSMDSQSKQHIAEIKSVLDGSAIKEVLNDINAISFKMNSVEHQVNEIVRSLGNAEKKIIEETSKKVKNAELQITTEITILNNNMANEFNKKNKIIIILIVVCIILILIK